MFISLTATSFSLLALFSKKRKFYKIAGGSGRVILQKERKRESTYVFLRFYRFSLKSGMAMRRARQAMMMGGERKISFSSYQSK
jgi:hypothetical protein